MHCEMVVRAVQRESFICDVMSIDTILSNYQEQSEGEKIIEALNEAKMKKRTGLNVTVFNTTALSCTAITNVLSSSTTLSVIEMEQQGSSNVYSMALEN